MLGNSVSGQIVSPNGVYLFMRLLSGDGLTVAWISLDASTSSGQRLLLFTYVRPVSPYPPSSIHWFEPLIIRNLVGQS